MRYPGYPDMKDSGIEWLGEVPAHWELSQLRRNANVSLSSVDKLSVAGEALVRLCNYVDVYRSQKITHEAEFMSATATAQEIARFQLARGDVLITKDSETWDDIAVPSFIAEDLPGVLCGYHLAHIRPAAGLLDGEFLFRAFQAAPVNTQFQTAATGVTRFGLPASAIREAIFTVPPLPEQRAIATFLDRKTQALDEVIRDKERLVEVLQEKRQALISQAVTKGLDPNVPMKDSGIEWLGEVPAHWTVAPLNMRYSVQLGKMLSPASLTGQAPLPYLRNVNIQWDRVDLADVGEMDFSSAERARLGLRSGDLLVCEGGEVGRTAIWRGEMSECYYQKAVHRLRPKAACEVPRFLYYLLWTAAHRGVFVNEGNCATIVHLTAEKLRLHRFPFPPADEQNNIVRHLNAISSHTEQVEADMRTQTDKLREYRQALITAAVTGKIDVRGK